MRLGTLALVTSITLTLGLTIPLQAINNTHSISTTWEKSPKYPEYIKAMEAGDLKTAMEIKKTTVNEITKIVLKDYIADFKDKYESKYLSKFQQFPLGLSDLTGQIHDKLSTSVKDKSEKGRNGFAKSIFDFISHYNKEDGKAEKYARKLLDKVKGGTGTPLANLIIDMGKQSDIEAAKSPEQKQREYDEFIANENQKQANSQRNIDKRNELINRMKSI